MTDRKGPRWEPCTSFERGDLRCEINQAEFDRGKGFSFAFSRRLPPRDGQPEKTTKYMRLRDLYDLEVLLSEVQNWHERMVEPADGSQFNVPRM